MSTLLIDSGNIPPAQFQDELVRAKAIFATQSVAFFLNAPAMTGLAIIGNDISGATASGFSSGSYFMTTAGVIGSWFRITSAAFAGTFPRPFPSGANWFCSARFSVDTVVDATTECYVGLADAGGAAPLRLGVHGPSSTVNYVLQGPAGTFIDSGVPIDTGLHTFRAFKTGGVTYCEVDNVRATGNVDTASDTCPAWQVKTGTVTPQQGSVQWWCGAAVIP